MSSEYATHSKWECKAQILAEQIDKYNGNRTKHTYTENSCCKSVLEKNVDAG